MVGRSCDSSEQLQKQECSSKSIIEVANNRDLRRADPKSNASLGALSIAPRPELVIRYRGMLRCGYEPILCG